jgi:hypothetical protein
MDTFNNVLSQIIFDRYQHVAFLTPNWSRRASMTTDGCGAIDEESKAISLLRAKK